MIRTFMPSLLVIALALSSPGLFATENETDLEIFSPGVKWRFSNGGEFPPGGRGSFSLQDVDGQPTGVLEFDFTSGGTYVAALTKTNIPEGSSEIRFEAKTDSVMALGIRLVDSTGQTHQTELPYTHSGEWQSFRVDLQRRAGIRFGGANDGIIYFPITSVWILVNHRGTSEPGEVLLRNFFVLHD
jgi:hypothetical protein